MGTEKLETGYGKESEEAGFEHENALSVLATAGEIDLARSTPSQSPANRKSDFLTSPLKYWPEVRCNFTRFWPSFDVFQTPHGFHHFFLVAGQRATRSFLRQNTATI
mmetsp:Transcript_5340/g.22638  ORF Transcript_5340/g.22638 Transcript_5340/m.22638 type:complete len:107 (+) Transcript_5340:736-1056(+)